MTRTIDEAIYWKDKLNRQATIVELEVCGTIHDADASLLLGDSEPLSTAKQPRIIVGAAIGDDGFAVIAVSNGVEADGFC